jgi:hypothetical protein
MSSILKFASFFALNLPLGFMAIFWLEFVFTWGLPGAADTAYSWQLVRPNLALSLMPDLVHPNFLGITPSRKSDSCNEFSKLLKAES